MLYESVGGQFDHPQAVTTTPVGEATLTFSDCSHGTMSYRFDDRDLEEGFFFDVHAGEDDSEFIFVSWFTYGDDTA